MEQKEELYKTLEEFGNPEERPAESGVLGNYASVVDVPNRPNYVYVRLSSGFVVEAFNNLVPPLLNLNVLVGTNPQRPSELKVLDIILGLHPDGINAPSVQRHGSTHEWPGLDTVWIRYRQILPLRPTVVTGTEMSIFPGWYENKNRETKYFPGTATNINFSSYAPDNGARWAVVSIDGSGIVNVTTEGTGSAYWDITIDTIPPVPENEIAICAVRCHAGQTTIRDSATTSTDVVDLRFIPQANVNTAATTAQWGKIEGTLSNQTDLQTALNGKQPLNTYLTEISTLTPDEDDIIQFDGTNWVSVPVPESGVPEAPINGILYGRKDEDWEEIISGSVEEDLTSQIDGITSEFTLSEDLPVFHLFHRGVRQFDNYDQSGTVLYLDFVPEVPDTLVAILSAEGGVIQSANKITGVDSAGNDKYYGTDASGTPGFHDLPSGGGGNYKHIAYKIDTSVRDYTTQGTWEDIEETDITFTPENDAVYQIRVYIFAGFTTTSWAYHKIRVVVDGSASGLPAEAYIFRRNASMNGHYFSTTITFILTDLGTDEVEINLQTSDDNSNVSRTIESTVITLERIL